MKMNIGYFAKPSGPDVIPGNLALVAGEFADVDEALIVAKSTADRLNAHSFIIDLLPDTPSRQWVRDGQDWKETDVHGP